VTEVFLSYASPDKQIARQIANDLRSLGTSVWFDEENLTPGQDWEDAISRAIRNANAVLVLISPKSLTSQWVAAEWRRALTQENRRLIPALIDGATYSDLPPTLRSIHAVDLNADYETGIRKINKSLDRLDTSTAPPIADSIDLTQITNDITQRVLQQLGASAEMPMNPATPEAIDEMAVFVISSFRPDMEPVFEAIAGAASAYGLRAERVKDVVGDYRITERMLSMIRRARFVVADLTHERPNVYFELGYARGIGKKVITILREGTERHFDVYDWNYISYIDSRPLERTLFERFAREVGGSD
jgi:hypothetical protein